MDDGRDNALSPFSVSPTKRTANFFYTEIGSYKMEDMPMRPIKTLLRMCAVGALAGLALLALPFPTHAQARVSVGIGVPAPVVVAPPPPGVQLQPSHPGAGSRGR